jgi:tetratricopeptide (TPR) repeat protein
MKDIKERFFSYLDGDMEVPDKQFFNHEIWRDKFLEVIRENDLLELEGRQKIRRISVKRKHLVIAAGILIIWGISVVFFNNPSKSQNDRIFASYYQSYKDDNSSMYRAATITDNFIDALDFYNKGDYQLAVIQFQRVIRKNTTDLDSHFFIGLSFIELHNYADAIDNFSIIINQKNDSFFITRTDWYLALCYLKTNQTRRAIALFNKIAGTVNNYQPLAIEILNKVK